MIPRVTLGKTGLQVSLIGLGCGGNSRLGIQYGQSDENAVRVVRRALELGINLIDTARGYGTEPHVGKALKGFEREAVVLSTKFGYRDRENQIKPAPELAHAIDASLKELGVETIDIYFIHGLAAGHYAEAVERYLPVFEKARRAGKLRFIGVTEAFESDTSHQMLEKAVADDWCDVIMVGFNLLNPSARKFVLKETQRKGIGVLDMFAVRKALINPQYLGRLLRQMAEKGSIDPAKIDFQNPLGFLTASAAAGEPAHSLSDAAYRFCRYEPGIDCVLSGTGSVEHLHENIRSIQRPPLPAEHLRRLADIFGEVNAVSGQVRE